MLKLMIVDDEANIRKGLREYISWDAWGIELAAEAENAEAALRIAAQVRPDILLTDIRMGNMDGIELTRRLKEMLPDLHVILLSGYSDIQYLQAALKMKVNEYLLKPAGADKIIEAVLKVKKEILDEREKWQENLKKEAFFDENITIVQLHFIDEIRKGAIVDANAIRNKAQLLKIPMEGPVYQIMLADVRRDVVEDGFKSGQELDMNFWQFVQKTNQIVRQFEGTFWCETGEELILFLVNGEEEEALGSVCASLAKALVDSLPDKQQMYIGIGNAVESPVDLWKSYDYAKSALMCSVWNPKQYILTERFPAISAGEIQNCRGKESGIIAELGLKKYEDAYVNLCELFDYYEEIHMDFGEMKKFCYQVWYFAMHLSPEGEVSEEPVFDEFRDFEELKKWMLQFWQRRFRGNDMAAVQYSELTRKTLRYIQAHYQEDITLQSLSKIVFASPNYLGKVFFTDVGCRMNDWLNRYRVERAKELLAGTDKKTYEIAEEVGFSGYKFFSVCFLRYEGCSARDYRNKCKEAKLSD